MKIKRVIDIDYHRTVAAIVPESGGREVLTNYYEWPQSVQNSMPRTDAVTRVSA